ncbi:MAG: phosphate ABC transporter permease [Leptolyngbyaceae cyanobacterium MO_188.B28]|nr:phosphate ABC transporter permease [Leptolyngbyaceae cyanobacterium MO_188.B28]
MLIPLTQEKLEELIPRIATADQYRYTWGKPSDFLRRLLISVVGGICVFILRILMPESLHSLPYLLGIVAGFYWLWNPVYSAGQRNREIRRYTYGGFWRGRVLDVFITDEVVGAEETVNKRGELVIVENRERRLTLEVGDKTGFTTQIQVPLRRDHRLIRSGDFAEMLVLSNRPDLSRINMVSDIYIPDHKLWVSDYPYVQKNSFMEVSKKLMRQHQRRRRPPRRSDPVRD